jgi:7-cyano-7-deazaguanine reductase
MKQIKGLTKLGSTTKYKFNKPDPKILETFDNKHPGSLYLVTFTQERDEFTSRCPVTNQPDFAKIEILYVPNKKMVESKSLKLYFFSFRDSGEFHEDVCNRMANDLIKLLNPKYLRVFGDFAPRGGIAIKPLIEYWEFDAATSNLANSIKHMVSSWDTKKGI